jgi:stalled ribosome rescue protein Dom34
MSKHAVVWIDHHDARIFEFALDGLREKTVKSHPHRERHPHITRRHETRHAEVDAGFYREACGALAEAEEILVVGPGTAKLELLKFAHRHAPRVEAAIIGVETVDHPTDGQVVAYARRYFKAADQLL